MLYLYKKRIGMKQIFTIILITLGLLAFIETSSWIYRQAIGRENTGLFWARGAGQNIPEPCMRFIFDLQLGYIHDQTAGCTTKNAEIIPGFVHYFTKSTNAVSVPVVTLGGSTTDGFLQYTGGYTWPYWFNEICGEKSKGAVCDVYNGGVGNFSSSRELRKLFRDVLVLNPEPKIIVSLNGENDLTNNDGPLELKYPYYDSIQLMALDQQRFPPTWETFEIFPNSVRALKKILTLMGYSPYKNKNYEVAPPGPTYIKARLLQKKAMEMNTQIDSSTIARLLEVQPISKRYAAALPQANFLHNHAELWKRNVELMHAIAKVKGAEYLVFVQPTLGLNGQNPSLMSEDDKKMFKTLDPSYVEDLNTVYDAMRKECKTLSYCIDITAILTPDGKDLYHDPRHPNAYGNKIIANRIFEEIKKRGLIP
jgi:hypothetical protein